MEKKELKFYETPAVEVVEMEAKISLLAQSDVTVETPGDEI